ncbi:hypothetical protein M6B38_200595 [Iris pallida]|uniref:Uncharacterized protein n=1 Tax=Iris pallida TaxID=29817 RepID=A0AAX6E957_IRIPA|nr:hypothetical protein M6B38_200595 [Iris pallida]
MVSDQFYLVLWNFKILDDFYYSRIVLIFVKLLITIFQDILFNNLINYYFTSVRWVEYLFSL